MKKVPLGHVTFECVLDSPVELSAEIGNGKKKMFETHLSNSLVKLSPED